MTLLQDVFAELEQLLNPISAASPGGRDLDGSLELNALEMASLEPEASVVNGVDRVDSRNWREIRTQAYALLEQSKDLRVATQLTRALLQLEGLPGFCAGVSFVTTLTERYWGEVYPRLDPDDSEGTARINAIQELVNASSLAQLRVAGIFSPGGRGKAIGINDLLLATSSPLASAELAQAPSHVVFSGLETLGPEAISAHLQLITETCERISKLTSFVSERTGSYLQFDALTTSKKGPPGLLDAVRQALAVECERMSSATAAPSGEQSGSDASEISANPRRNSSEVSRREDVVVLIERICAYYARVEPSSPVPLLLQRAKRLATMDFLEIVRDLADQGLPQVGTVAGIAVQ